MNRRLLYEVEPLLTFELRSLLLLLLRVRHLRQFRLLVIRELGVPVVEAGNVLVGGADEEIDEVGLGLVVAVAKIALIEETHEAILSSAKAKIYNVWVVFPAVIVILLIHSRFYKGKNEK